MVFDSSKDILFIVIAVCIGWVTIFLCWMLYYVTKILKNTSQIIEEFRTRLQGLLDAVNYVRDKVENMSNILTMITSGVGGMVQRVVTKKAEEWASNQSEEFDEAAKDAVHKAVKATADKMKRFTKKVKK